MQVLGLRGGSRKLRVQKHGDERGLGYDIMQHFEFLGSESVHKESDAGDVASWSVEASNESGLNRIGAIGKDDRDIRVAAFAARQASDPPPVKITDTPRRTKSAARFGSRSR